MPRVVDHDARRRLVAECATRLIADAGTDAATVREVARAAGFSTTVVSHYFTDKRELLMFTYHEVAVRTRARVEEVLAADPTDLRGSLLALLPLDADRRRDWRVNFAFWGRAASDDEMAREQRARVRSARELLAGALRLRGAPDPAATARRLLTHVIGIAIQAVFDPGDWPRARQVQQLDSLAEW